MGTRLLDRFIDVLIYTVFAAMIIVGACVALWEIFR